MLYSKIFRRLLIYDGYHERGVKQDCPTIINVVLDELYSHKLTIQLQSYAPFSQDINNHLIV